MLIGIDGKAKKVVQPYFGVDGKAKKVTKVYMGVDGKSKLVWPDDDGPREFDMSDPNLKYFKYAYNTYTKKDVIIFAVDIDAWYEDHGNYNVEIPKKLGGYNVIISDMKILTFNDYMVNFVE